MRNSLSSIARLLAWLSVILFMLSLAMPAFRFSPDEPWVKFSSGNDYWPGFIVLMLGWLGVPGGHFAWLANPLWFVAMVFFLKRKYLRATQLSIASFFLAVTAPFLHSIPVNATGGEGAPIHSMGLGYYVWLGSICAMFLAAYSRLRYERFLQPNPYEAPGCQGHKTPLTKKASPQQRRRSRE